MCVACFIGIRSGQQKMDSFVLNFNDTVFTRQCSKLSVEGSDIVLTNSIQPKRSLAFFADHVGFILALMIYHLTSSWLSIRTYVEFSMCTGLNAIANRHRISGLPAKMPKFLFLSFHHRHYSSPAEFFSVGLLESFQRIYVVVRLGFHASKYLINSVIIFGKSKDEQYFTIYDLMHASMLDDVSCAVIVYTDRCGSAYFGHQEMLVRPGIHAASLALQVPIMDIAQVESTPVYDEMNTFADMHEAPALEECPRIYDAESFALWRSTQTTSIEAYRLQTQQRFRSTIQRLEEPKSYCSIDAHAMCPIKSEFQRNATNALNEVIAAKAHGLS